MRPPQAVCIARTNSSAPPSLRTYARAPARNIFTAYSGAIVHRQRDHDHLGMMLNDPTRGVDAIEGRHAHIHNDDIRLKLFHQPDGSIPVGGFTHHLHAGLAFQSQSQTPTHSGVVIHNQYSHTHNRPFPRVSAIPG